MNDEQILRFAQLYFQRPVEVIFSFSSQCCPETTLARGVWPHNHQRRPICLQVTRSMRNVSILFSTIKVSFFLCNKCAPYLVFKHFLQMLFLRIFKFSHCIETGKSAYTPQPNRSKTFCAFQSCHHPRSLYLV